MITKDLGKVESKVIEKKIHKKSKNMIFYYLLKIFNNNNYYDKFVSVRKNR